MKYHEWEDSMPEAITGDSLWKMEAYRLALFVADIGWHDVSWLMKDKRTVGLSDQLYRAIGSIGVNLAEGYSRGTGKDCARFYEYALGSARESRDWYYKARHLPNDQVVEHRMDQLASIIRLVLTMLPQQRQNTLKEEATTYLISESEEIPFDAM